MDVMGSIVHDGMGSCKLQPVCGQSAKGAAVRRRTPERDVYSGTFP